MNCVPRFQCAFNPLKKLARSPASRAADGLLAGQTLMEVMRDACDALARQAVREALVEFSDGPAALLITCLLEASTAGWAALGGQLKTTSRLPPEHARWASARLTDYGRSLASDEMTQHLINLVLSVTGLHVEALILTREQVDAHSLTERLAELLKQGLSSGLSRADLARTLSSPRRPDSRLASSS